MRHLRVGIHEHAIVRAFRFARPKSEDDHDEEYEDEFGDNDDCEEDKEYEEYQDFEE